MKHIAFCKLGKSIKFSHAGDSAGGDCEPPLLLRILANNNPDKTFYIVGRSDYSRLSEEQQVKLFPYGNVIDCWKNNSGKAKEDHISNYFKNLGFQPDLHICMVGQVGTVTIPDKIQQVGNPNLIAAVIDMTRNYTTPIVYWMNENEKTVPVVEIINDPRYTLRQSRDIIVNPVLSLSQYDYSYVKNTIKSYADQSRVEHNIPCTYSEMEKIFLYNREKPSQNRERNTNFMIVLNEGYPSRYNMLKEWVLGNIKDTEIYGRWEHTDALSDSRFKGSMELEKLQKKLQDVRCTFIIPIEKGWVTSKYVEMIHAGVIPIFHPTYDEQNHLEYPKELRPKNPAQMVSIVNRISSDSELYSDIIGYLQKKYCKPEYYNGSRLSKVIFQSLDKNYTLPNLDNFDKIDYKASSIEDFFA